MVLDYDFALGRVRLRGTGWRGLAALGMLLVLRIAAVSIIAYYASIGSFPLLQRTGYLFGG